FHKMIVVRKLENTVMNFIFPAVAIYTIVCDFLYEYEWVTFGLQFGPLFATIAFIILMVLLDSRDSDDIEETKADKEAGRNRVIFIIVLIISLNIFWGQPQDRKSTRLNSSHVSISYAVFCLKKK